ncbi:MAG: hypothetical protein Q9175_007395 [Cornicularia normoerica]
MSPNDFGTADFNSSNVDLSTADPRDIICALAASANEYNRQLGVRISVLFVIMALSIDATFFPVIAKRVPRLRIPLYVYLFARYFGAGVIVSTAFIHLLDPADDEIGPNTCIGMTGGWAKYPWCPATVLTSVIMIFLLNFEAERYIEIKYNVRTEHNIQGVVTGVKDGKVIPQADMPIEIKEYIKGFSEELEYSDTKAGRLAFK